MFKFISYFLVSIKNKTTVSPGIKNTILEYCIKFLAANCFINIGIKNTAAPDNNAVLTIIYFLFKSLKTNLSEFFSVLFLKLFIFKLENKINTIINTIKYSSIFTLYI